MLALRRPVSSWRPRPRGTYGSRLMLPVAGRREELLDFIVGQRPTL